MASGFSSTYNPRTRNHSGSLGLAPRVLFNNTPRPRYPITDRSGVPLSHTRRRIVCGTMPPVSQTCRFFRAGLCQYGDRCRFFHIEVPPPPQPPATSNGVGAAPDAGTSTDAPPTATTHMETQQQTQQTQPIPQQVQQTQKQVLQTQKLQQLHQLQQKQQQQHQQQQQQTKQKQSAQSQRECVVGVVGGTATETEIENENETETEMTDTETETETEIETDASSTDSQTAKTNSMYDKWLEAPEFVPSVNKARMKSYAEAVNPSNPANPSTANVDEQHDAPQVQDKSEMKLCPYAEMHGVCSYSDGECTYLHGDICDLCGTASLHPFNQDKRKQHIQSCIEQHERNMELSFAVQRSKEKSCGVCFEIIMEKAAREQRFGILPNCNHCFCLTCIRKWRQAKQFDNKIIRACPECRVTSDFVCPSMYWVDTKEEKEKLIKDYKCALSLKNCKYFKQGRGKCPFGNKCFYLHALPDGTKTDVGPPPRQPRRQAHDGDIDVLQQIILWDFLDERENRWLYSIADDLEDLVAFFSDSEDSDWSDYEVFFD